MDYLIDEKYDIQKEIIRKYENYTLYRVYGVLKNKKVPLYKTCEN